MRRSSAYLFSALAYSWLKKELDLGAWQIDCHDIP
jgi:hypothetical protein